MSNCTAIRTAASTTFSKSYISSSDTLINMHFFSVTRQVGSLSDTTPRRETGYDIDIYIVLPSRRQKRADQATEMEHDESLVPPLTSLTRRCKVIYLCGLSIKDCASTRERYALWNH